MEALKKLYLVNVRHVDVPALQAAINAAKSSGVSDKIIESAETKLHFAQRRLASIERSTEREEVELALKKAIATPVRCWDSKRGRRIHTL